MYMNVMYVGQRKDALHINVGAEFETPEQTKAHFEKAKTVAVDLHSPDAIFMLDLHHENGDIEDTIGLSAEGYTKITGEPVLTESEYEVIHKKYTAECKLKFEQEAGVSFDSH